GPQALRRGLRRRALDGERGHRPRGAGADDRRVALRALHLAPGQQLRDARARGAAQRVRRPRGQEGLNMNDVAANPLRKGLMQHRTGDAGAVVIFGASGDLTRRKLMPALYNLAVSRALPGGFAVVGQARREKTHEQFRAEMKEAVGKFSRRKPIDEAMWKDFERGISYVA